MGSTPYMHVSLYVLVLALATIECNTQENIIITKTGKIQGEKFNLQDGQCGLRFLGIPYAIPPLGDRRFQAPEAITPWNYTLSAKAFGPICFQPLESDVWDIEETEMDIQTLHAQLKKEVLNAPQKDQMPNTVAKRIQEVQEYIAIMKQSYANSSEYGVDGKQNISQLHFNEESANKSVLSASYKNASSEDPFQSSDDDAAFPGSERKNKYLFLKRKYLKDYNMSEDCLTLNIYKPIKKTNRKDKWPVLVFIHGGSFYSNGGRLYPGERLTTEGLIVVTVNYRLGPFGFLSTEDASATGNFGLLDQVQALKWIHKNIQYFDGDPKRILLAGNSAGGASVIFHMLSPLSKGLFSSVAAMSGCALAPWSIQANPLQSAKKLAKGLKCPTDSSRDLIKCLRKASATAINQEFTFNGVEDGLWLSFAPIVDDFSEQPFLPSSPRKLINQGNFLKVPVLMMMTLDEVTIWFRAFPQTMPRKKVETWMDEIIRELYSELNDETLAVVSHIIRGLYTSEYSMNISKTFTSSFSGKLKNISPTIEEIPVKAIANLFSDIGVRVPCMEEAILLSERTPTYLAEFTYISEDDVRKGSQHWIGAYHESDLLYLFGQPLIGLSNSLRQEKDKFVSSMIMNVFKSFAATGTPNVPNNLKWLPYTAEKRVHYELSDGPKLERFHSQKRYNFWMSFLPLLTERQLPKESSATEKGQPYLVIIVLLAIMNIWNFFII